MKIENNLKKLTTWRDLNSAGIYFRCDECGEKSLLPDGFLMRTDFLSIDHICKSKFPTFPKDREGK